MLAAVGWFAAAFGPGLVSDARVWHEGWPARMNGWVSPPSPVMATGWICFPGSVGITHTCPICQAVIPGSGQAPCYPCSRRRRSESEIAEEAATIPIRWMVGMFIAFYESGRFPLDNGLASERIARTTGACRQFSIEVPNPDRLTTDALHAAIGADGARRVAPVATTRV